jgi:aurora kinase
MAKPLPDLMSGLSLAPSSPSGKGQSAGSSSSSNTAPTTNRLPTIMKKYMNPGLVRPPNAALAAHASAHGESQRGPLLKLAGVNVHPNSTKANGSPSKQHKPSLSQHTAHGLHGPAHSTTSRAQSSSLHPQTSHPTATAVARKVEIGKYDGGLEIDEAGKEAVTGEAGKILEMDSSASAG